jgi:hypothetical protein
MPITVSITVCKDVCLPDVSVAVVRGYLPVLVGFFSLFLFDSLACFPSDCTVRPFPCTPRGWRGTKVRRRPRLGANSIVFLGAISLFPHAITTPGTVVRRLFPWPPAIAINAPASELFRREDRSEQLSRKLYIPTWPPFRSNSLTGCHIGHSGRRWRKRKTWTFRDRRPLFYMS